MDQKISKRVMLMPAKKSISIGSTHNTSGHYEWAEVYIPVELLDDVIDDLKKIKESLNQTNCSSDDHPMIQSLMNKFYASWNTRVIDRPEMLLLVNGLERLAVEVGNLNYQVENGGFEQWHGNRYSETHEDLIKYLKVINTPACREVASLVHNAYKLLQDLEYLQSTDSGESASRRYNSLHGQLNEFDERYYTLNKQMLTDVENYLKTV